MVHLPTYVALKATYGGAPSKYLGVEDDGKLAYSTERVVSDRAKFAIEPIGDGVAHIRSCYNNKYWVRSSESENWIVAAGKDPVADKTAWNCTLFRANVSDDGKTVKFVHVQLGKTVGRRDVAPDRNMYLCLEPLATTEDNSAVVDYGSITILPQYVAFKDPDGHQYFNTKKTFPFVTFTSDDIGEEGNSFEIVTNPDGLINLKSSDTGKCLQSKCHIPAFIYMFPIDIDNVIVCYQDYMDDDTDMLFSIHRVDKNVVALRHIYTNKFLERIDLGDNAGLSNYGLMTTSNTITKECRLHVEEPVLARQVNVFEFHLDRARIYDLNPLALDMQTGKNQADDDDAHITFVFSITTSWSRTWSVGVSWTVGMKVTLTSGIPKVAEGSVEISEQFSAQYNMGETESITITNSSSYTAKVPPRHKVTVTAVATQGKCDVPFSYDQVDLMPDGKNNPKRMTDGVFTGVNAYNFEFVETKEPL